MSFYKTLIIPFNILKSNRTFHKFQYKLKSRTSSLLKTRYKYLFNTENLIPQNLKNYTTFIIVTSVIGVCACFKIKRDRTIEENFKNLVSTEDGWSPNPKVFAKRKYKKTKDGWFPVEDAFGGGKYFICILNCIE